MAVQVKVHDNVRALRSACVKHAKKHKGEETNFDFDGVLGICHRFHMQDEPVVALVRLAPPHVGAGIVAHEMTHAAVWLWEIENKFSRKTPLNCNNDEWFAWILGDLVRHTTNKLYEHGVYSR